MAANAAAKAARGAYRRYGKELAGGVTRRARARLHKDEHGRLDPLAPLGLAVQHEQSDVRIARLAQIVRLGVMDHSVRGRACHFARVIPDDNSAEPKEFGRGEPRGAAGALDWALKPGLSSFPSGRQARTHL